MTNSGDELSRLVSKDSQQYPDSGNSRGVCWRIRTAACIPKRFVVAFGLFSGLLLVYILRVTLSVAIVPMTKEFGWDSPQKGFALAAFFIGYIMLQVPGGWLCRKIGGKTVFGLGVLVPSIVTIATPFSAQYFPLFICARVLTGLGESATYPAVHAMLGHWAPSHERSRMVGFIWSGAYLGTTVAFPVAGYIIGLSGWFSGWRTVFYVSGIAGIVWSIMWYLVLESTPAQHPTITPQELHYIQTNIKKLPDLQVPWKAFFTNTEILAIVVQNTTHNWIGYTLLTWLPSYLKGQLGFNIKKAGVVAVLPYLCCFLVSNIAGVWFDYRISRGMRVPAARRVAQLVAEGLPAVALVAAGYVSSVPLAVALLCVAVGLAGAAASGYGARALDIAPEYAGILMGITNGTAQLPGIISPYLTGIILGDHPDQHAWLVVFYLAAAVTLAGLGVWLVWARTEHRLVFSSSLSLPGSHGEGH